MEDRFRALSHTVKHRRLLIYSSACERSSTMQIRLVEPLRECGYEFVQCGMYHRRAAELARVVQHEVDAVVVHREVKKHCKLYGPLLAAARACRKPVICDIDALLFQVCQDHPDYRLYQAKALCALKAVVDADFVLASTPTLASHLAPFHGAVTTVANRLPPRLWRAICERVLLESRDRSVECVTIGYVASHTHRPDLRHIEGAVTEVLRRYCGRVCFLSVGVTLLDLPSKTPETFVPCANCPALQRLEGEWGQLRREVRELRCEVGYSIPNKSRLLRKSVALSRVMPATVGVIIPTCPSRRSSFSTDRVPCGAAVWRR